MASFVPFGSVSVRSGGGDDGSFEAPGNQVTESFSPMKDGNGARYARLRHYLGDRIRSEKQVTPPIENASVEPNYANQPAGSPVSQRPYSSPRSPSAGDASGDVDKLRNELLNERQRSDQMMALLSDVRSQLDKTRRDPEEEQKLLLKLEADMPSNLPGLTTLKPSSPNQGVRANSSRYEAPASPPHALLSHSRSTFSPRNGEKALQQSPGSSHRANSQPSTFDELRPKDGGSPLRTCISSFPAARQPVPEALANDQPSTFDGLRPKDGGSPLRTYISAFPAARRPVPEAFPNDQPLAPATQRKNPSRQVQLSATESGGGALKVEPDPQPSFPSAHVENHVYHDDSYQATPPLQQREQLYLSDVDGNNSGYQPSPSARGARMDRNDSGYQPSPSARGTRSLSQPKSMLQPNLETSNSSPFRINRTTLLPPQSMPPRSGSADVPSPRQAIPFSNRGTSPTSATGGYNDSSTARPSPGSVLNRSAGYSPGGASYRNPRQQGPSSPLQTPPAESSPRPGVQPPSLARSTPGANSSTSSSRYDPQVNVSFQSPRAPPGLSTPSLY